MKDGNYVAEITDPAGLARAADWEVYGKRSTRYRITHAYPDGDTVRSLPADGIAHVKINVDNKITMGRQSAMGKIYSRACGAAAFRASQHAF